MDRIILIEIIVFSKGGKHPKNNIFVSFKDGYLFSQKFKL